MKNCYWYCFRDKIRTSPLHWRIGDFIVERGQKPTWEKTPNGWKNTSERVKRIYFISKLPQYHSRLFRLLKQKRR